MEILIEKPKKLIEWIRDINEGDVKYAEFNRNKVVSIRSTVCGYNKTLGYERGNFVHIHFCWDKEVAVLVAESREEVESNKYTEYEYTWRDQIHKDYR